MIPHRCPVCLGHGNVPGGFYNCTPGGSPISGNVSEICRACSGSGVIYCREDEPPNVLGTGVYPPQYGAYPGKDDEILQVLRDILSEIQSINRNIR